jgi:ParB family chromosome partitioning protein
LIAEFGFTQQQVADVVGKDRSTIANILRVLGLPAAARRMVQEGQLTLGHARALLAIENERALVELAKEVVAQGMSVREVERRVKEKTTAAVRDGQSKPRPAAPRDPQAGRIEDQLRRYLQTDVHLRVNGTARGEIRIQFYNNDDLERILELVLGGNGDAL